VSITGADSSAFAGVAGRKGC